jgi:hypothetical protein
MKPILLAAAVLAMAACARPSPQNAADPPQNPRAPVPATVDSSTPRADAGEADTSRIARLEREARAIARADGCTAGECRTAPVGHRACGGPRTYIVYCAAHTDSAALFAKLAELARAEDEYNQRNQMASTCEFREPPSTKIENGSCVAAPGVGMTIQ